MRLGEDSVQQGINAVTVCDATELNPEILALLYFLPAQQADFPVRFEKSQLEWLLEQVDRKGHERKCENFGLRIEHV